MCDFVNISTILSRTCGLLFVVEFTFPLILSRWRKKSFLWLQYQRPFFPPPGGWFQFYIQRSRITCTFELVVTEYDQRMYISWSGIYSIVLLFLFAKTNIGQSDPPGGIVLGRRQASQLKSDRHQPRMVSSPYQSHIFLYSFLLSLCLSYDQS